MTYTVQFKKSYALRILRELEKEDAVSIRKSTRKKNHTELLSPSQQKTWKNIKRGFDELALIEQGKLSGKSAEVFLDEIKKRKRA